MSRTLIGVGLLLVGGLASMTCHQAGRWQSDQALWCQAITVTPDKPRALNNCATALMRAGYSEQALPLLERAASAVETPQRPENRRSTLRTAIAINRALALVAVQRPADARVVVARVDLTGEMARWQWLRE